MANQSRSPCLTRFLSDFTLGFSDGLTVPFALTAGLSSLGKADTVIYAGLAELCAGSISMGIGGYLSAVDELPSKSGNDAAHGEHLDEEELTGMLRDRSSIDEDSSPSNSHDVDDGANEKRQSERGHQSEESVRRYLEPLGLPSAAVSNILNELRASPGGLKNAAQRLQAQSETNEASNESLPVWPVASGLSISLGYVIGGVIPLFPYFFAATVGLALRWSITVCLIALMAFGSGKSWILRGHEKGWKRCLWEGVQMMILGTLAAGASVLCVHLLGAGDDASG